MVMWQERTVRDVIPSVWVTYEKQIPSPDNWFTRLIGLPESPAKTVTRTVEVELSVLPDFLEQLNKPNVMVTY